MISGRWQHIKEVLTAVEGISPSDRETALNALCAGDVELRREVDSLLAHEHRIDLLNEPAEHRPWVGGEPTQVGPYRIERLIGAGGMGAVYLATRADDQYRKQVAVKIIQSLSGNRLEQRFRTERQILANLEHPAVARLLDGGTLQDGRPYLVMEYVEGRRIDEYVDEKNLSVEEILQLFLKVCAAVRYAHQNLIVHRDLKAGNILVTASGDPRLLDFGIAKMLTGIVSSDEEETRPFERLLTPSSASPEQVSGGAITTASDVYSLGLLLYRLLTGKSAYAGAKDFRTNPNAAILHYDPPLAGKVPGLSPQRAKQLKGDLELILAKTLEKDTSRRYGTVEELSSEIQNYLQGRPIRARPASRFYIVRKFVHRNRLQLTAAGLLAAAIAGGLAGTILYARRAEREKELAVKRLETLRHISESLLFEFHDSIKDLPGSTQARSLVVRRTLEYLNELASEESTDPSVQKDLAAAYVRIGGILAGERAAHIGGPEAMKNARAAYEKALTIRRSLFAANPNDASSRADLLESLWNVAGARQEEGRTGEAIQLQQERLKVIQNSLQPQNVNLQYSLAATYAAMSDLHRTRGDFSEALALSQQSLKVREALFKADPASARARRSVALSHQFIGYALANLNRYSEAAQEHEKALAVFDTLLAATPASTDMQRNVGTAESDLCEMLVRSGSATLAIPHCRRGVQITEAMHEADSSNVQAREDLAAAYATMGFAVRMEHENRAALSWDRRADAQFQSALDQDPDANEAATEYADILVELAKVENELHDPMACGHLQKARSILQHWAVAAPGETPLQTRLSDAMKLSFCP